MGINVVHPRPSAPRLVAQHRLVTGAILALLAVAACALVATQIAGQDRSVSQVAPAADAWPGELVASERAAIEAALGSPDPRTRRLAVSVAAGEAGALALADGSVLHHHGVNTAIAPEGRASSRAERFHHR